MDKKIIIIAGPNGAGKTSFARTFLPIEAQCLRFINADLMPPVSHPLPLRWLPSKQDASCWKRLPIACDVKKASHLKPRYPALVI